MIGEIINNYRIVSTLGKGGMGTVYLAEHPFIGRKAAMKVLRSEFAEDANVVERFMNEARAANAIRHPHIIDIIDVGRLPSGIPYLMMEFLDGESLAQRIRSAGRLPLADAIHIAVQTAGALGAAHTKDIVHRDLKPDNLFLTRDDEVPGRDRIKVLDFGIAKLRGDLSGSGAKTQTGSLMGTPPYMSPEQCRGLPDEIDHRTDVYALGIILYEMLCGAPPFVSAGWGEVVLMHITRPPRPPRELRPDIPPAIEAIVLKALAKERQGRFQSMGELQAALRAAVTPWQGAATELAPARATPGPQRGGEDNPGSRSGSRQGDGAIETATSTTFKTASGQLEPRVGGTGTAPASTVAVARKPGRWLAALAGLAVAGAIGVGILAGPSPATPPPSGIAPAPQPAPVRVPAPTAPPPVAVATAPIAGAAPRTTNLKLLSTPPGATVIDEKSGEVWGTTPMERQIPRGSGVVDLYMEKAGFTSKRLSVPLDEDFEKVVSLQRRHLPATGAAPAKAPRARPSAATSAPHPADIAPPIPKAAAVTTPPKPKPTTEKW